MKWACAHECAAVQVVPRKAGGANFKNDRLAEQKAESAQKCEPPLCHLQKRSLVISVLRKLFPCPISCHLIRRISCHVGPSHLISFHLIQPRRIQKRKQESKQGRKKAYAASKQGTKGKKYARRAQLRNQPTKTPDDRPFENQVFVPEYMGKDKTENICQYMSKWMLDNISRQIRAEINKEKCACPRFVHGCAHTHTYIHACMHTYANMHTCVHAYRD